MTARPEDLAELAARCPGTLAVAATGPDGDTCLGVHQDTELPLASVGKLLLLAETARRIDSGTLDPAEIVEVRPGERCSGSGLLTALSRTSWSVADLALLTAAVSDNTATNALLRRVGLDEVNAGARSLGLSTTRLLDRIREPRLPEHPPAFALGTAAELAHLAAQVTGDEGWARLMVSWMAANTDRSLAPALVPHDPESRERPEHSQPGTVWVANKTGTDAGTRTDVGVMIGTDATVAYAVLAHGPAGREHDLVRAVRQAGRLIARPLLP
ncbi:serine hydrolase [Nonomuraea soli]|uniref:Beta-lactamase class A n=1 Tax=Nonomuraea soli TaxID=1032476 RepID=A0A7W0CGY3_9ACTN|nr:serine hydrolase [Nonomuraea soli]MBA2890983.1 beta-lactamase class A [Nonomuraea soli]